MIFSLSIFFDVPLNILGENNISLALSKFILADKNLGLSSIFLFYLKKIPDSKIVRNIAI